MKTSFNVAWVDDNFSDPQMKSSTDQLTRKLYRKNNFSLRPNDVYATAVEGNLERLLSELAAQIDLSNSVDLVVVDYELGDVKDHAGNKLTGEVIAKSFRDALPTVDIIFYSGKKDAEELRLILANANVDCVNCVGRGGLVNDTFTIIENVIERSCKISTLRGLILNSVCEMDDMIIDTLSSYYFDPGEVRDTFVSGVANYIGRNAAEKRQLRGLAISGLLGHKKITSGSLFIYLRNIKDNLGLSATQLSLLDNYEEEILELRNSAAHMKEGICNTSGHSMLENQNSGVKYKRSNIDDICKVIVGHEKNIKSILDRMPKLVVSDIPCK